MDDDWISIREACKFLDVSRPTLNSYRRRKKLRQIRFRGQVRLSKTDIIKKVVLGNTSEGAYDLTIVSKVDLLQIQPIEGVYDLRLVRRIEAYGVMSLLCSIKDRLKRDKTNKIYLILKDSPPCRYLEAIGFF